MNNLPMRISISIEILLKSFFLKASNIIHITQKHAYELRNTPALRFSDALMTLHV